MSDNFNLGQVITTVLTPNSKAVTSATGGSGQDTIIQFLTQEVPYWTAMLSNSNTSVVLNKNTGNSVVTFKKGLTVTFIAQAAGEYIVTVDGKIIDGGTKYKLQGKFLGKFSSPGLVKRTAI